MNRDFQLSELLNDDFTYLVSYDNNFVHYQTIPHFPYYIVKMPWVT